MRSRLLPTVGALGLLVGLLGVTPLGEGATNAVRRALFASNAGAVNGIQASRTPKANRLVPLGRNAKFPRSVLPAGLQGPPGAEGQRGAQGPAGPQGPQGPAGRSALASLQSGERVVGVYALEGQGPNLWTGVTLPIPAPVPVDSLHVVIAGNDTVTGDGCIGTAADPVAGPGFVCIYPLLSVNTTTAFGWGVFCSCGNAAATGDGSRFGFIVQVNGTGLLTANGVWTYTAP